MSVVYDMINKMENSYLKKGGNRDIEKVSKRERKGEAEIETVTQRRMRFATEESGR